MPFTPTIPARATDWDVVVDDARSTLIANTTLAAATLIPGSSPPEYRIFPRVAPEGTTGAYIILDFFWTYESSLTSPGVNGLMDISCYSEGWSTTITRAMLKACIAALVNRGAVWVTTSMATEGVTLISAAEDAPGTGGRNADTVTSGVMTRGKQTTIRVIAIKL